MIKHNVGVSVESVYEIKKAHFVTAPFLLQLRKQ